MPGLRLCDPTYTVYCGPLCACLHESAGPKSLFFVPPYLTILIPIGALGSFDDGHYVGLSSDPLSSFPHFLCTAGLQK